MPPLTAASIVRLYCAHPPHLLLRSILSNTQAPRSLRKSLRHKREYKQLEQIIKRSDVRKKQTRSFGFVHTCLHRSSHARPRARAPMHASPAPTPNALIVMLTRSIGRSVNSTRARFSYSTSIAVILQRLAVGESLNFRIQRHLLRYKCLDAPDTRLQYPDTRLQ